MVFKLTSQANLMSLSKIIKNKRELTISLVSQNQTFNVTANTSLITTITAENGSGEQVRMSEIGTKDNTFYLGSSVPAGKYTLKILPAYADYVVREKFDLDMEEIHYFTKKYSGKDTFDKNTIFQGEEYSFKIKLDDIPPMIPDGYYYYGKVKVDKNGKTVAEKEVRAER